MTTEKTPVSFEFSKLSNIHGVLSDAVWMSQSSEPMRSMSIRLHDNLRQQAEEICAQNGTSLSVFLRQCTIALVNDYNTLQSDNESEEST